MLPDDVSWDVQILEREQGSSVVVDDLTALEQQLSKQTSGQMIFMSNGRLFGDPRSGRGTCESPLKKLEGTTL